MDKKELYSILDEVERELIALSKAEEEGSVAELKKADPGEEARGEGTPEGSSTEPAVTEETPGEDHGDSMSEETPGEEPEVPAEPETEPKEAKDEGEVDPAADTGMTPEALQAEYATLSPEELKMHLLAVKAAYMAAVGGAGNDESNGDEGGVAAPAPKADVSTAAMGDEDEGEEEVSPAPVSKSESDEIALLKKSNEELESQLADLAGVVKTFIERPMRKAVTGIEYVSRGVSEAPAKEGVNVSKLSKSEVIQKLDVVTRTSKDLKKSDRDLINKYIFNEVSVEKIAHLISE